MKRANKTGTIFKRRDKKRRKPFCVYLDGGNDPDTFRRKRIFLGSFATQREAQEYLEQYRSGNVTEDIYTHKSLDQLLAAVNSLPYGCNLGEKGKSSGVATG